MCVEKLQNKVFRFYNERKRNEWQGKHFVHGRTPNAQSIRLISNDYLAIANHPSIFEAQKKAFEENEPNLLMSTVFQQKDNPQAYFEERLANYLEVDEVVLCQSGYNANTGLIQSIVENTDMPVYVDMMAHMSLWDGIRLGNARMSAFRHNDIQHLLSLIAKHGPGLVVVDSVYSTNGSICPLKELVETAYAKGCILLVDESHSLGTHGPQGRGLVVELGLTDKVMFRSASLAKAFVGRAGMITCPRGFSDYFKFTSKPSIFSSALLPYEIAGLSKTLDLITESDERRERLHKHSSYLRAQLTKMGYNLSNSESQIIALESGSEWNTIQLRDSLEMRGVFGSPFCAPATPKNRALVRLSVNAGLTDLQVQRVVNVCRDIRDEIKLCDWPSTQRLSRVNRSQAKVG